MNNHTNELDFLREISVLNNEMANAQRNLEKQNAEVNRLNVQLKEANKRLEQFNYIASHDLKEPLRMITSFMQLLKDKYGSSLDEKAKSYIDFSLDGGRRMQKMMDDLLELSLTGISTATKKQIEVQDILDEVQQNIFKLSQDASAVIIIKNQMPVISAYRSELLRLFQNLLSNAIKFRKKDLQPVIEISASEEANHWVFRIEDNGIGIQADKFDKIFEIFSRLNSKKEYEGSGIGLAVCKKIAEHHGGTIRIESIYGKGSVFTFTISKK